MVWEMGPEDGARIVGAIVKLVLTDNQPVSDADLLDFDQNGCKRTTATGLVSLM